MNDRGQNVKEALPGIAVEVLGFEGLPDSGDKFDAPINDQAARKSLKIVSTNNELPKHKQVPKHRWKISLLKFKREFLKNSALF